MNAWARGRRRLVLYFAVGLFCLIQFFSVANTTIAQTATTLNDFDESILTRDLVHEKMKIVDGAGNTDQVVNNEEAPMLLVPSTEGVLTLRLKEILQSGGTVSGEWYQFWFQSEKYPKLWAIVGDRGFGVSFHNTDAPNPSSTPFLGHMGGNDFQRGRIHLSSGSDNEPERNFKAFITKRVFNHPNSKLLATSAAACLDRNYSQVVDYPEINRDGEWDIFDADGIPNECIAATTIPNSKNVDPWINHWGVTFNDETGAFGSDAECGIGGIQTLITDGIGKAVSRVIACTMQYIFTEFMGLIEPFFEEAAKYSSLPDARTSLPGQQLKQLIAPSALAQTTTPTPATAADPCAGAKDVGFECELRKPDGVIVSVWSFARSLLNIIVIVALLAIAFANILHLNINTYAAKKILPGLVIGVIGANASLLIMRFLADVTQAVSLLAVSAAGDHVFGTPISSVSGLLVAFPTHIGARTIEVIIASLVSGFAFFGGVGGALIIGILLIIYYLFVLIGFAWVMFKRVIILYFLAMVAPLAFVAYGIPQAQKHFYSWWNLFLRYLFVWPVVLFGMALTIRISNVVGGGTFDVLSIDGIVKMILVLAAAHLTLKLPKIMTNGVLDMVGAIKNAAGFAPRVVQGAQDLHGKYSDHRVKRFVADDRKAVAVQIRALRAAGRGGDARQMAANYKSVEAQRRDEFRKKFTKGKTSKFLGSARGFGHILADPENSLKKAWAERQEASIKGDVKASSALSVNGVPVLETIKGRDAGYRGATAYAAETSKDFVSASQYKEMIEGNDLAKHLKERYESRVAQAMSYANNDPRRDQELKLAGQLQDDIIAASKFDSWDKLGEKYNISPDLLRTTEYNKATARQYFIGARKLSGRNNAAKAGERVQRQRDAGFFLHGTPGEFTDENGNSVDIGAEVDERIADITRHAEKVKLETTGGDGNIGVQRKLSELMSNWTSALNENLDALDQNGLEKIRQLRNETAETLKNNLSDDATELRGELDQIMSKDISEQSKDDLKRLRSITENHSLALASGAGTRQANPESIQHMVAGAKRSSDVVKEANQQVMAQIDTNALASAITQAQQGQNEQLMQLLGQHLQPHLTKMAQAYGRQADPQLITKALQQVGTNLTSAIAGRDPRSLKSVLKQQLDTLPDQIGLHTLSEYTHRPTVAPSVARFSPPTPPVVPPAEPPTPV